MINSSVELLIQAVEKYACSLMSNMFNISSLPAQALLKYGIRNIADKYSDLINIFVDKEGKINTDLLFEAFKSEVKNRGGIVFMGIKFKETDFEEIKNIYIKLKQENV